jgi:hypothetical protein
MAKEKGIYDVTLNDKIITVKAYDRFEALHKAKIKYSNRYGKN